MWSLIQRPSRYAARPIVLGLVVGSLMIGGSRSLAAMTATESVQNLLDRMVQVLEDKELQKPEHAGERRMKLEKIFEERFSYEEMAKRSLAAQWPKLDETQQHEFVGLFQKLLTNTYASRIQDYSGQQVKFLNERLKDGYAEVRTKIMTGKAEIPLDYRLLRKSDEWFVYDLVLDGVSMVSNYRGQFSKILHSSSYEDLVEKLRHKSDTFSAPKADDKAK
jgi:phospholipid transport system substrate-binding protein